jgi:phosphoribosyl 1,2-cyclic phosphodiesterase
MQQRGLIEDIIFIGTGTSEGIPLLSCLTNEHAPCNVCNDALLPNSKNRRRNTSLLIRVRAVFLFNILFSSQDERLRNIVIDVGKFFWEAAMSCFPKYNIRFIDSILITHDHISFIFIYYIISTIII